jgi:lipoprotein-anchoring transpeptidase ErfK/SrfK
LKMAVKANPYSGTVIRGQGRQPGKVVDGWGPAWRQLQNVGPYETSLAGFLLNVLFVCGTLILVVVILAAAAATWFGVPEMVKSAAAVLVLAGGRSQPIGGSAGGSVQAVLPAIFTPVPATFTPAPTVRPTFMPAAAAVSTASPTPTKKPAREGSRKEKRIVVSISEQHLYAYQGTSLVYSFIVSTGRGGGTATGTFEILDKMPKAYSDLWGFWMPYWMGIYWAGNLENGFHSLPVLPDGQTIWGDQLGSPVTYGCVVLDPQDAKHLYNWADLNTVVEIRK